MGVKGLWKLLQPCCREISFESLHGIRVAVDLNIWLHEIIKGMTDENGETIPGAHIIGLFNRLSTLLAFGITPVLVLDGPSPVGKRATVRERETMRRKALNTTTNVARQLIRQRLKNHGVKALLAHYQKLNENRASSLTSRGDESSPVSPGEDNSSDIPRDQRPSNGQEGKGNKQKRNPMPTSYPQLPRAIPRKSRRISSVDSLVGLLSPLEPTLGTDSEATLHEDGFSQDVTSQDLTQDDSDDLLQRRPRKRAKRRTAASIRIGGSGGQQAESRYRRKKKGFNKQDIARNLHNLLNAQLSSSANSQDGGVMVHTASAADGTRAAAPLTPSKGPKRHRSPFSTPMRSKLLTPRKRGGPMTTPRRRTTPSRNSPMRSLLPRALRSRLLTPKTTRRLLRQGNHDPGEDENSSVRSTLFPSPDVLMRSPHALSMRHAAGRLAQQLLSPLVNNSVFSPSSSASSQSNQQLSSQSQSLSQLRHHPHGDEHHMTGVGEHASIPLDYNNVEHISSAQTGSYPSLNSTNSTRNSNYNENDDDDDDITMTRSLDDDWNDFARQSMSTNSQLWSQKGTTSTTSSASSQTNRLHHHTHLGAGVEGDIDLFQQSSSGDTATHSESTLVPPVTQDVSANNTGGVGQGNDDGHGGDDASDSDQDLDALMQELDSMVQDHYQGASSSQQQQQQSLSQAPETTEGGDKQLKQEISTRTPPQIGTSTSNKTSNQSRQQLYEQQDGELVLHLPRQQQVSTTATTTEPSKQQEPATSKYTQERRQLYSDDDESTGDNDDNETTMQDVLVHSLIQKAANELLTAEELSFLPLSVQYDVMSLQRDMLKSTVHRRAFDEFYSEAKSAPAKFSSHQFLTFIQSAQLNKTVDELRKSRKQEHDMLNAGEDGDPVSGGDRTLRQREQQRQQYQQQSQSGGDSSNPTLQKFLYRDTKTKNPWKNIQPQPNTQSDEHNDDDVFLKMHKPSRRTNRRRQFEERLEEMLRTNHDADLLVTKHEISAEQDPFGPTYNHTATTTSHASQKKTNFQMDFQNKPLQSLFRSKHQDIKALIDKLKQEQEEQQEKDADAAYKSRDFANAEKGAPPTLKQEEDSRGSEQGVKLEPLHTQNAADSSISSSKNGDKTSTTHDPSMTLQLKHEDELVPSTHFILPEDTIHSHQQRMMARSAGRNGVGHHNLAHLDNLLDGLHDEDDDDHGGSGTTFGHDESQPHTDDDMEHDVDTHEAHLDQESIKPEQADKQSGGIGARPMSLHDMYAKDEADTRSQFGQFGDRSHQRHSGSSTTLSSPNPQDTMRSTSSQGKLSNKDQFGLFFVDFEDCDDDNNTTHHEVGDFSGRQPSQHQFLSQSQTTSGLMHPPSSLAPMGPSRLYSGLGSAHGNGSDPHRSDPNSRVFYASQSPTMSSQEPILPDDYNASATTMRISPARIEIGRTYTNSEIGNTLSLSTMGYAPSNPSHLSRSGSHAASGSNVDQQPTFTIASSLSQSQLSQQKIPSQREFVEDSITFMDDNSSDDLDTIDGIDTLQQEGNQMTSRDMNLLNDDDAVEFQDFHSKHSDGRNRFGLVTGSDRNMMMSHRLARTGAQHTGVETSFLGMSGASLDDYITTRLETLRATQNGGRADDTPVAVASSIISSADGSSSHSMNDITTQYTSTDHQQQQQQQQQQQLGDTPTDERGFPLPLAEFGVVIPESTNRLSSAMETQHESEMKRLHSLLSQQRIQSMSLSSDVFITSLLLARLLGVEAIVGDGEADATCEYLFHKHYVDAVMSNDNDLCVRHTDVLRHAFHRHKPMKMFQARLLEPVLGITRDAMMCLALILGNDYAPGIHNVGPVQAMEIIANHAPNVSQLQQYTIQVRNNPPNRWVFPTGFPSLFAVQAYTKQQYGIVYSHPASTVDVDGVCELLYREAGWDHQRTQSMLHRAMHGMSSNSSESYQHQLNLIPNMFPASLYASKRLQRAVMKLRKRLGGDDATHKDGDSLTPPPEQDSESNDLRDHIDPQLQEGNFVMLSSTINTAVTADDMQPNPTHEPTEFPLQPTTTTTKKRTQRKRK